MFKRRLKIYRKNVVEPIELHDSSGIKNEEFEREIRRCFTAKDITIIVTDDGVLSLRPSEVTAILIQDVKENSVKPVEEKITDDNIDEGKT